jgi:secreted trypsin-like serine protease
MRRVAAAVLAACAWPGLSAAGGAAGAARALGAAGAARALGAAGAARALGAAGRIVGGQPLPRDSTELPWVVSLQSSDGFHFCGGSLIAPTWVMTAAHCSNSGLESKVVGGVVDLKDDRPRREERRVVRVIVHDEYDPYTLYNDIALWELEAPLSSALTPVALVSDPSAEAPGRLVYTAGWGKTEAGHSSELLRKVGVPVVSTAQCTAKGSYDNAYEWYPGFLCAGYKKGGKDSCQGDSGGPLFATSPSGKAIVIGVVSWGDGCAEKLKYGVYSRVSSFVPWILEQTGITPRPTAAPTIPTARPTTTAPTARPTNAPTAPTALPTKAPTAPTGTPTVPSARPTKLRPSAKPTTPRPSKRPTILRAG